MASETLLIFVLMLSSVRLGKSAETLFNVKCQSAVGVIGQTTNISCSIESQNGTVHITVVSLTRFRENQSCFTFQSYQNSVTGDSRFKGESLPSLQLHNTSISDEGGYRYYIRAKLGKANAEFRINVTGDGGITPPTDSTMKSIIACVIVIVFLIVCLLIALSVWQWRLRQLRSRDSAAVKRAVYEKTAADDEETVAMSE